MIFTRTNDPFIEFEESNLNALINNIPGVMWSVSTDYTLITSNLAFDNMLEQMSGQRIKRGENVLLSNFPEEVISRFRQYYDRAFSGETFAVTEYYEEPFERWSEISFYPIRQNYNIVGTACYSHDITRNKLAEAKLMQAKRLYSFISSVNQAIVHNGNEEKLFDEICRIAVVVGEFELAIISSIDERNRKSFLVSEYNSTDADLDLFTNLSYDRNGPTENVIAKNELHVICDIASEPENSRWKQYATSRGFSSMISLPLKKSRNTKYVLTIFSKKQIFWDKNEIALLKDVATDISFTIDVFEKEKLRIKTESELKHKELQLCHAQEIAHVGSWELDFNTRMAKWSEEHCRIYGVPVEENIQSYDSWLSFIHPEDLDHVLKMSKEGEMSLNDFSFYHRIIRRDGIIRHIFSQNRFEFNRQGIPVSLYGVSHDVTGIKEAEEKLRHSAFRFNQAQEITHLGNWELNFETGVSIWSEECCRIYGLLPNDNNQSYEDWLSFIHPDDLEHVMNVTKESQATLKNHSMYHRIVRKDGTIRHLHSQAHFEFDSDGKPIGLYGTAHDITEQSLNIARLKAQNEQLKEIAWIQSHKVRGPLASILGLAQLYRDDRSALDVREITHGILTASQKLDAVIREIVSKTSTVEVDDLSGSTIG